MTAVARTSVPEVRSRAAALAGGVGPCEQFGMLRRMVLALGVFASIAACGRSALRVPHPLSEAGADATDDTLAALDASEDVPAGEAAVDIADTPATDVHECQPPRPIAPLSTSIVTTRRPMLAWIPAAGSSGTIVDLCVDVRCTELLDTIRTGAASAQPERDLPPGVVSWRVRSAECDASGPTWTFNVPVRSTSVQASWGSLFDVDRDGVGDLLAASVYTNAGFVYRGATGGLDPSRVIRFGVSPGGAVRDAGDVNGDGFADVIAHEGGSPPGVVRVFYGGEAGVSFARSTPLDGAPGSQFGISMAGLGDVNHDGYGDIAIGAPATVAASSGDDTVSVYFGGPDGVTRAPTVLHGERGSRFGDVVASAGDANGDGYADLVVRSGFRMTVSVFMGSASGFAGTPSVVLTGRSTSSFGESMANAGDVNGDGYADLVVGDPTDAAVWLYPGSASGLDPLARSYVRTPPGNLVGWSLALAGDVDADGYADFAGGAPGDSSASTAGFAFVVFGAQQPMSMRVQRLAPPPGSMGFGWFVSAADYDRDVHTDIAVGAYGSNQAFVFPGAATGISTLPSVTLPGGAL